MSDQRLPDQFVAPKNDLTGSGIGAAGDEYVPPRVIAHDTDEFVRSLGPAQACSPAVFP